MSDSSGIRIAHAMPGRLRLKVPGLRTDPSLRARITDEFGSVPGILHIDINSLTASVLVHYDMRALDTPAGRSELSAAMVRLFPDFDLIPYRQWLSR